MSKLGRNDKCPCGSGKKYKKCCMDKQVQPINIDPISQQQFQDFLPKLLNYSKTFDEQLQPIYKRYSATYTKLNDADARAFSQILFHWLVFNAPVIENKRTIVEQFVDEYREEFDNSLHEVLDRWTQVTPSLLLIEKQGETATVKDSLNGHVIVPDQTAAFEKLDSGDFLFGYIYPTITGSVLGTDALLIPDKLRAACLHEYNELYRMYKKDNETESAFVKRHFPAIIGILVSVLEQKTTEIPKVGQDARAVYTTFYQSISLEDYSTDVLLTVKNKWLDYYAKQAPRIQKPEVFAAALEYWASKQPNQWTTVTQKGLSEKYNVSATTISSRFKELDSYF
ncbi:YecA family protein [Evansella cellulosilytica]|uniref:SEC-C motif domain protein n=1 Tax=Evansella cellulosilytica (strain ATCC 21833 / DSM 2522 / FERM P-1141 / JCM 9156 / N-4) TaxID=649639 RepID=E6TWR0_EVAC2|nr:SEC-C domain-containing protein [Evansella cellulosilytica]ADU28743.1 SEC-C motif domain protein [Evansella cellulosilytica DSM 2522]